MTDGSRNRCPVRALWLGCPYYFRGKFMKITTTIAVAVGLLGLAACKQSPTENKADQIEANAENTADTIEANADNMADNVQANAENRADAVRNAGETKADSVRNSADADGNSAN
jgi:hypothetical protein